jgi:hypothetical protein
MSSIAWYYIPCLIILKTLVGVFMLRNFTYEFFKGLFKFLLNYGHKIEAMR